MPRIYLCSALVLIILLSGSASPISAESRISGTTLKNGLNVLCIESHAAPLVSIYMWYRYGGRNENPGATGISYLLANLRFASSRNYPSGEIERMLTGLGADFGTLKDMDYTAFYESLPAPFLDLALKIEADRMKSSPVGNSALKQEKSLSIYETERDEKNNVLSRAVRAASFTIHPYRQPLQGYPQDINSLNPDMLLKSQVRYYTPRNAILVIAGDFNTGKAVDSIEKYFGAIPAGPVAPEVKWVEPEQKGERRTTIKGSGDAGIIEMAFRTPAASDPDIFSLALLDSLLASGKSSRLARALVDRDLASSVHSSLGYSRDPSLLTIRVNLSRGTRLEDAEKVMDSEFERLRTGEISAREFQKAVNQVTSGFIYSRDSAGDLARNAGFFSAICGDNSDMIEAFITGIPRLTPENIMNAARKYLTEDNRTVGWFVPPNQAASSPRTSPSQPARKASRNREEKEEPYYSPAPKTGEAAQSAANSTPPPSSLREDGAADIKRVELENGLVLISRENHENSTVSFRVQVRAGSLMEPPKREGMAFLLARMMEQGAGRLNAMDMAELFDYHGAEFSISADRQVLTLQGRCQASRLEPIIEAVADILQKPLLPDRELERVRSEIMSQLKIQDDSPRAVAERELTQAIYPEDHPMRRSLMGTENTLKIISRKDLLDFYRKHVRPDTTALALVGDVSSGEALVLTRKFFGGWKASGVSPEQPVTSAEWPASPGTRTFYAGNQDMSFVLLGQRGISRKDPGFYAANIMNFILGGGPMSRLATVLRGKKSLALSVSSSFSPMLFEGPWAVRMVVRSEDVEKAKSAALEEIIRIQTQSVTEKELKDAKTYLVNRLPLALKDNSAVAEMLLHEELYGLGTDYVRDYREIYGKITAKDIKNAAENFLKPTDLTTIIVNPKSLENKQ
jgi:zinc protease